MANILDTLKSGWNKTVDILGNLVGIGDSDKRAIMFKDNLVNDDDIRKLADSIQKNIVNKYMKQRDLSAADIAKAQNLVDSLYDRLMSVNQNASPFLKTYINKAKDQLASEYYAAKNQLARLQRVDEKLSDKQQFETSLADQDIQNAYSLSASNKKKDATELKRLQDLEKQTSYNLSNYERRMNDEI